MQGFLETPALESEQAFRVGSPVRANRILFVFYRGSLRAR